MAEDFLIDASYIVAVALVLSWFLPPLTLEERAAELWVRFDRPWRGFQHRFAEFFPTTAAGRRARVDRSMATRLRWVGRLTWLTPRCLVRMPGPSRLQAMVYDLYDGRQWWSQPRQSGSWTRPSSPLPPYADRELVEQTVTALARRARL